MPCEDCQLLQKANRNTTQRGGYLQIFSWAKTAWSLDQLHGQWLCPVWKDSISNTILWSNTSLTLFLLSSQSHHVWDWGSGQRVQDKWLPAYFNLPKSIKTLCGFYKMKHQCIVQIAQWLQPPPPALLVSNLGELYLRLLQFHPIDPDLDTMVTVSQCAPMLQWLFFFKSLQ